MTKPLIYMLFLLALCSCRQTADRSSVEKPDSTAREMTRIDSVLMELGRTPDSLRTPEQQETIRKIQLMVARYMEISGGVASFTLSKHEFVEKTGLDIEFYDAIMKNVAEINSFIAEMADTVNIKQLEESFSKQKKQLLEEYGD